jgi:hypothetical protein
MQNLEIHLSKTYETLSLPGEYTLSLTKFIENNQEKLQTNAAIHSINTRGMYDHHRPVVHFTHFQNMYTLCWHHCTYQEDSSLKDGKAQFKVALTRYLNTRSFYHVDKFLIFIKDL